MVQILVDGFMRETGRKWKDLVIPKEINAICMDYFHEPTDRFSKTISGASCYDISDDGLTAIKINDKSFGQEDFPSIFGEKLIESMDNNTIYSWTFKMIKVISFFCIGISAKFVTDYSIEKDSYIYNGCVGCLRCHGGDRMWNYGPDIKADDKIEMIYDAGKGYLSFIINDKPIKMKSVHNSSDVEGVAFVVKKGPDLKYRMGVSVSDASVGLQLIGFKQTHS